MCERTWSTRSQRFNGYCFPLFPWEMNLLGKGVTLSTKDHIENGIDHKRPITLPAKVDIAPNARSLILIYRGFILSAVREERASGQRGELQNVLMLFDRHKISKILNEEYDEGYSPFMINEAKLRHGAVLSDLSKVRKLNMIRQCGQQVVEEWVDMKVAENLQNLYKAVARDEQAFLSESFAQME